MGTIAKLVTLMLTASRLIVRGKHFSKSLAGSQMSLWKELQGA